MLDGGALRFHRRRFRHRRQRAAALFGLLALVAACFALGLSERRERRRAERHPDRQRPGAGRRDCGKRHGRGHGCGNGRRRSRALHVPLNLAHDQLLVLQDDDPLDHVLELADVARAIRTDWNSCRELVGELARRAGCTCASSGR